jgi:hypothetical protein
MNACDREPTEDRFNQWLARQLYLSVRRLKHFGVAGRCEAISRIGSDNAVLGYRTNNSYQCAMAASMMRDGHRVCRSHGERAFEVQYVDTTVCNPYQEFARMLAECALLDEQFLDCVKEAVECAEAIKSTKAA